MCFRAPEVSLAQVKKKAPISVFAKENRAPLPKAKSLASVSSVKPGTKPAVSAVPARKPAVPKTTSTSTSHAKESKEKKSATVVVPAKKPPVPRMSELASVKKPAKAHVPAHLLKTPLAGGLERKKPATVERVSTIPCDWCLFVSIRV